MYKFTLSAFADEISPDLNVQIEVLKKHDIHHLELRGIEGKNVSTFEIPYAKEVKKILDANGIKVSAIGSPIGKIRIDGDINAHFDLFRHVIELAEIFETDYIRMFSFYPPENSNFDGLRDKVLESLNKMVEIATPSSVTLLHENEKGIYGDTAANCIDILSTINSPKLRATFDPANFVQCGEYVLPCYELMKDYADYFHIKDAVRDDEHLIVPAGQGDSDIKALLDQLKKDEYKGFITLEPHLGNFAGFSDLELDDDGSGKEESDASKFALAVECFNKLL